MNFVLSFIFKYFSALAILLAYSGPAASADINALTNSVMNGWRSDYQNHMQSIIAEANCSDVVDLNILTNSVMNGWRSDYQNQMGAFLQCSGCFSRVNLTNLTNAVMNGWRSDYTQEITALSSCINFKKVKIQQSKTNQKRKLKPAIKSTDIFAKCSPIKQYCAHYVDEDPNNDHIIYFREIGYQFYVYNYGHGEKLFVHEAEGKIKDSISVSSNGLVGFGLEPGQTFPTNSNFNTALPNLKLKFNELGPADRKKIQTNLAKLSFYQSTIDGVWGKNTFNSILTYSTIFMQNLRLRTSQHYDELLNQILEHDRFDYQNGIPSKNISTCSQNASICSDMQICVYATQEQNGVRNWTTIEGYESHRVIAKARGLLCNVTEDTDNSMTCAEDPNICSVKELCERASALVDGTKMWRDDPRAKAFVTFAKDTGLQCGIKKEREIKQLYKVANGSGVFISSDGHILTNYHVVEGCEEVRTRQVDETKTTLLARDTVNDLALLKIESSTLDYVKLSRDEPYLNQAIIAAGYPFGNSLSSSVKITRGIVSSLTGLGDNTSNIQIDAALQPGNSGGAILNDYGELVGIAVAKLDTEATMDKFGVLPENVNFGVKLSTIKSFLDMMEVPYIVGSQTKLDARALGKVANTASILLTCWMTQEKINELSGTKLMYNR